MAAKAVPAPTEGAVLHLQPVAALEASFPEASSTVCYPKLRVTAKARDSIPTTPSLPRPMPILDLARSGFGTTGSDDVHKRELAAFFANVMHETGGLCYINEINPGSIYCQSSAEWPCASGKSYFGRGPLQLSWNYNYGAAGKNIVFDGINNPEKVGQDATVSFKTAVWFWMLNSKCHEAITSGQGFGGTIQAINSMECNGGNTGAVNSRGNYYKQFCQQLGVDPGSNVSC
eukprot:Gb_29991 [translate_table: standard]